MFRYLTILTAALLVTGSAAAQSVQARPARPRGDSTLKLMNQRLPEVRFEETPFDQVTDWLGEITQMNIVVRWQILEDALIKRDKPISMQAKNLRLSQILWLLLNEAAGSETRLAYRASGNLLVISTADDLGKELVTKVYDVSDLLLQPPSSGRPDFSQNNQGLSSSGTSGGGGSGQSVFGNTNQNQQNQQNQQGNDVQIQKLIEIIEQTVEPDSWAKNGGIGHIQTFGNLLIVRNTILVHQQIGGYLKESEVVGQ
jgi:hypothetical protein